MSLTYKGQPGTRSGIRSTSFPASVPQSPGPAWNKEAQMLSSRKGSPSSGLFHSRTKQTRGECIRSLRPSTKSLSGPRVGGTSSRSPRSHAYLGCSAAGTGVGAPIGRLATFRSWEPPGRPPPGPWAAGDKGGGPERRSLRRCHQREFTYGLPESPAVGGGGALSNVFCK